VPHKSATRKRLPSRLCSTHSEKSPIFSQKSPIFSQKSPIFSRREALTRHSQECDSRETRVKEECLSRVPRECQKSPIFSQKSPMFHTQRKEPYNFAKRGTRTPLTRVPLTCKQILHTHTHYITTYKHINIFTHILCTYIQTYMNAYLNCE